MKTDHHRRGHCFSQSLSLKLEAVTAASAFRMVAAEQRELYAFGAVRPRKKIELTMQTAN
ncbi:hypothetical protein [Bradyrhizobium manausense]|uniref:hypothetical protein n=1 Tax=Bradyrhizobium manausense TaxID=989370 RepID=UPI001BAD1005|nr:hypothetical protein [Bradyrhizobium manausense]